MRIFGEHTDKHRLGTRNLLSFLLCLLCATIIWYGHALSTVRSATITVPITYTGIPDNVGFSEPLPDRLSVELRDAGKRLGYYMQMDARIEVDLSGQFVQDRGHIHISADQLRPKLSDFLQGTTSMQTFSPDVIHTDYYKQHEKTVPIILVGQIQPAAQYRQVGVTRLSRERVHIYGSRASLDSIHSIRTEQLAITNAKDSIRQQVRLIAPNGIRMAAPTVEVSAYMQRYTEKSLQVPLHAISHVHDQHLRLFDNTVTVVVQVGMDQYADVTEKAVRAYVEYTDSSEELLPVHVQTHDSGVVAVRVSPARVEYIMESL